LLSPFRESLTGRSVRFPRHLSCANARPAASIAAENYRQIQQFAPGGPRALARRLTRHGTARGAKLMLAVRRAGITWQLARTWPGDRARERQLKRQGGAARRCPLCGVTPRPGPLPRNTDGRVPRSLTTDAQKARAGLMTAAQRAEHTALRRGAVTGRLPRPAERGPLADDPWAVRPALHPLPHLIPGGTT
jgi:hypothetical protein